MRFALRLVLPCTAAFAVCLALSGCQSFETGIQTLCDAPSNCGAPCSDAPADQQTRLIAEHAAQAVRNEEAVVILQQLDSLSDEARVTTLRQAAERAQLSSCRFADHLESRRSEPAVEVSSP